MYFLWSIKQIISRFRCFWTAMGHHMIEVILDEVVALN